MMNKNIHWQNIKISKENREKLNNQKAFIIWFTGLSGSGKSTIANVLEQELYKLNKHTYLLDGDNVRHGLNKDLGFSNSDRSENIRRIAETAKLFVDAGIIVLVAFISPFQKDREFARNLVNKNEFIEVFVKCSLQTCETRDTKGLYKKARKGDLQKFTGIDSDYETPKHPEIIIDTELFSIDEAVKQIKNYLKVELDV